MYIGKKGKRMERMNFRDCEKRKLEIKNLIRDVKQGTILSFYFNYM